MRTLAGFVALLLMTACSSAGGGNADDATPSATNIDRLSADRAFSALAETALDGASPADGVRLEADCPMLGDRSVVDVITESGVAFSVDGARADGSAHGIGEEFAMVCSTSTDDGTVSIRLLQTPAMDAAELVRLDTADAASFDTDVRAPGFAEGSLVVSGPADQQVLAWVSNGFAVQVAIVAAEPASLDDQVALLTSSRDAVLETLAAQPTVETSPAPDPVVERSAALDAVLALVEDGEAPKTITNLDEKCPFLDEDRVPPLVGDAGWSVEPTFGNGTAARYTREVVCTFGEVPEVRSISVTLGRPMTVAEIKALVEGPISASALPTTVAALETSAPDLDGRAYVLTQEPSDHDGPAPRTVGWIDNGLRIEASVGEGEDPEQVLAAVVPTVLDSLDLS